jgi:hypothetical protein
MRFLLPALIVVVLGILVWLIVRGRSSKAEIDAVRRVLAAHGPARCSAATSLLADLARRGAQEPIAAAWEQIELPLLKAVPDCPPDLKGPLIEALEGCARCCPRRELARRLIDLRNSLLAGA